MFLIIRRLYVIFQRKIYTFNYHSILQPAVTSVSVKGTVYLAMLLVLLSSVHTSAQNLRHLYKMAEGQFYSEDPHEALIFYQKIADVNPSYEDVAYKVELCILLAGDAERSLDTILQYRDTRGRADKFYYYWLGKVLDYRYEFEEAILAWEQFLKVQGYKSQQIIDETRFFIRNTRNKIEIFKNQNRFQIVKLSDVVNSYEPELTPTYIASANQLLFASSRGNEDESVFNVFKIERHEDKWGTLTRVSSFGDFYENTANLMLVNEDGRLFMYRDRKGGDLYFSEFHNNRWTIPLEFDSKITNTHLGSHFYINEHEDRIVFSTDKHFKKRGLDIYQSYKNIETGKWSKPAPFTETINSELDEDSPFLSTDEKTLYFSSTGHETIGGYDVFKSEFDETTQTWSEPVNLGYPINTPDDEIQFKISIEGDEGFLSSNRLKPVHDYDIYQFYEAEWTKIEGKVYDLITREVLKKGEIEFGSHGLGEERFTALIDTTGKYKAEVIAGRTYAISISDLNEQIHKDEFEVIATETPTLHLKNFYTNGDLLETETTLARRISSDDPARYQPFERPSTALANLASKYRKASRAVLNNIYFDFGTSALKPESNHVLRELYTVLVNNPHLKVEIAGHTDNVGTPDVNLWLSENRAKSVKKAMVDLGIPDDQIVARGYGETRPFASNDNEQEGRELNRRIEVLVIQ